MQLDSIYWENRYRNNSTGWDVGYVSTPLKAYFDQLENKDLSILIPGAGNSYEAEYLLSEEFRNIHVLDFSDSAIKNAKKRIGTRAEVTFHNEDFFAHQGFYDLIIEQTFFCAIDPGLRENYVLKTNELLKKGGKLVGLLWDAPMFPDHPPYGGSVDEYERLFSNSFNLDILTTAYNSIAPRSGTEVFIKFIKK